MSLKNKLLISVVTLGLTFAFTPTFVDNISYHVAAKTDISKNSGVVISKSNAMDEPKTKNVKISNDDYVCEKVFFKERKCNNASKVQKINE